MESAVLLATIHDVKALWSSVVALAFFSLKTSSAYRNCVHLDDATASIQQQELMIGFEDQNFCNSSL